MNILITGTSTGLGFGLAKHYLEKGNRVFGISRSVNTDLINYPEFNYLSQDLSLFQETELSLRPFLNGIKSLDLVILNAGILNQIADLKDTSLKEIKQVMDINVWANKVLIDTLFHQLPDIKQVVAISSGASVSGARGWNAYSLSKATLNMLISLYSNEFTDTHFCALAPGLVDTKMQEYLFNVKETAKFPVVERLQKARGTAQMPTSEKAAENVAQAIEKVKTLKSGSFQDVRKI